MTHGESGGDRASPPEGGPHLRAVPEGAAAPDPRAETDGLLRAVARGDDAAFA
ncbi:hypothetical protein ACSNN7_03730 [Micromonospora sp. URMC 105]|uniref:hypothetical protein n=1 Tax=Micromonospora sp. URMC 105 TaxID=3423413 RepID=UPI003F1A911F